MNEKKLYTWNFDRNESFNNDSFETIEECINDAKKDCDYHGQTIYVGEIHNFNVEIDAHDIISSLQECALYNLGEVADGWLDSLSKDDIDDLSDTLTKQFNEFLKQHNEIPWFYGVENIKEY